MDVLIVGKVRRVASRPIKPANGEPFSVTEATVVGEGFTTTVQLARDAEEPGEGPTFCVASPVPSASKDGRVFVNWRYGRFFSTLGAAVAALGGGELAQAAD